MHDEELTRPEPVQWGPCPKGEWQRLSEALRSRKRNSEILSIIAIVLAVLAIAAVTWMLTATPSTDSDAVIQPGPACHSSPSTGPGCNNSQKAKP